MDFAFIGIWISFAYIGIVFARRLLRSWINPVSVYWMIWTISIVVGRVLFFWDSPLSAETWIVVMTAALVFTIAGFSVALFLPSNVTSVQKCSVNAYQQIPVFAVNRIRTVFVICLVLELIRLYKQAQWVVSVAGGLDTLMGYGGYVRSVLILGSTKANPEMVKPFLEHLSSYFLSMGGLSLFIGAYLLRIGQGIGLVPLVLEALMSAFTLQRYQFILALLIFLWSYWYFGYVSIAYPPYIRTRVSGKKRLLLIVIIVFSAIITWWVLALRHPGIDIRGIVEHTLSYLGMPLWALDVRLRLGYPWYGITYGASTFWGVAVWAKRLGVDVPVPPYHYDPVILPSGELATNVFTYLINPIDDWGWPGLALLPGMIGGISAFLHLSILRYRKLSWIPAQSVVMATITMSFYTFVLKELYYILLVLGFSLLIPFLARKVKLSPLQKPELYQLNTRQ